MEIHERNPSLEGEPYPLVGLYERITGRAYFAVDPELGPNSIITDILKVPRNDQGEVEFTSDFVLIRPVHVERGNGALLYEVSNRGGKNMLGFFNLAKFSRDPKTREEFGDGLLMSRGFTLLWLGWQLNPPHTPGIVRVCIRPSPGIAGGSAGGQRFRPVPSIRNHRDGRRWDSERASGAGCTRRPRLAVQESRRVAVVGILTGRTEISGALALFLPPGWVTIA